jgi:protein TorT
MKDAYWLGVDYGVADEAKRQGVKMQLVEAGGYTELQKQISQIEDCVAAGAQAVVIGAISYDGLNNLVAEIRKKNIPVIDVINGISSPELSAKSLVSFGEMGAKAGEYLAKLHPAGSPPVKVAWFPGPPGAGWVEAGNTGFLGAVKGSAVEVVETKYGDTGKEVQAKLVEDTLQAHPDISYIVGTAVTAEAAIPIVRDKGIQDKVKILAYYYTPGVDQGAAARSWRRPPTRRSFRGASPSIRRSASSKARTTSSMSVRPSRSSARTTSRTSTPNRRLPRMASSRFSGLNSRRRTRHRGDG